MWLIGLVSCFEYAYFSALMTYLSADAASKFRQRDSVYSVLFTVDILFRLCKKRKGALDKELVVDVVATLPFRFLLKGVIS